jgi:hypothetical protein
VKIVTLKRGGIPAQNATAGAPVERFADQG